MGYFFEKSRLELDCLRLREVQFQKVRIMGRFENSRVREFEIPLFIFYHIGGLALHKQQAASFYVSSLQNRHMQR